MLKSGHFYFGETGHFYFGMTGENDFIPFLLRSK